MTSDYRNDRTVLLSGGVGGARMARGLSRVLAPADLTIVVNVGDDAELYGVHVAADLDTVVYTLAGIEGPEGWGIRDDTFSVLAAMGRLGLDTAFRLGDRDLATCLARTTMLAAGQPLSAATRHITGALGVAPGVLPATDGRLRTRVRTGEEWLDFQEYFVLRRHADRVDEIAYDGAESATPAPNVVAAIEQASRVVIAPSNPPLSIWPILAVDEIREAVEAHPKVIAVSPLIGGAAVKGPAADVMAGLGLAPGNAGVVEAYDGLIHHLVIDHRDAGDEEPLSALVDVVVTDILIKDPTAAARLAAILLAR